jgi:hypothetical protein
MRFSRLIAPTVAAAALLAGSALPLAASAREHGYAYDHHQRLDPAQRAKFAQRHLDRQAAMLEIKASQQPAWDAYAAAKLALMTGFDNAKPLPPDADAAAIARRRADRAETVAQDLGKLADATAKLQSTLTDDQRKVLDRMTRSHWHGHDRHDNDWRRRDGSAAPKR